jgi:hypothetical protein
MSYFFLHYPYILLCLLLVLFFFITATRQESTLSCTIADFSQMWSRPSALLGRTYTVYAVMSTHVVHCGLVVQDAYA